MVKVSSTTLLTKPKEDIDFSSLPWNLNLPEHHSYVHIKTTNNVWNDEYDNLTSSVHSYQNVPIGLRPAATSLNYGTTVWEGLKCYRLAVDGTAAVFRADMNYERMKNGAIELCLPMPSRQVFFRAIQVAIQANAHLIPPAGDGMKLYVRPILLGSGEQLGLYPSPEFSFIVYVSPTGNYFKSSTAGLNIHLEMKRARAAKGGLGSTKCSGNYAVALKPLMDCKKLGFMDNIFLELETYTKGKIGDAIIQEMSAANIFLVLMTGEIVTPSLDRGTILPGVTRDSIIRLVETYSDELKGVMLESTGQDHVFVSSRDVMVHELTNAAEAFCTGTAAELVPIARIASSNEDEEPFERIFPYGATLPGGPVTSKLLSILRESMSGQRAIDVTKPWIRDPFASADDFCCE